jgi:putative PIN family toxin of toxin-antitoxin system
VIRAVIDTNVYISGTFWVGVPKALINEAKLGKFKVIISDAILREIERVLSMKTGNFRLSKTEVSRIKNDILEYAEVAKPENRLFVCSDESDNKVLECAAAGDADYIITGDSDLLVLNAYKGIKIFKPRAFEEALENK